MAPASAADVLGSSDGPREEPQDLKGHPREGYASVATLPAHAENIDVIGTIGLAFV